MSAAFQDFARWEFSVGAAVGIGDLAAFGDNGRVDAGSVTRALDRAGASDLLDTLPNGLDTQLGPS